MMKVAAVLSLFLLDTQAHAVSTRDPLPTRLLSCGGAIINEIGPRLDGDTRMQYGAQVSFNDGAVSVAYGDDPAIPFIKNSRVGDHALVCLVFVPKNCPRGDDRGRMYTITNLRTLESWTLRDAEHQCGGA